ncbi:SIR2 family protein [Fuerstiella marisgermanici]|uniref:Uncharacterized protein n=1 Tax=Fuerstiella marisgermanici TaxID=1891926 RepID=A0A1P8WGW6_9PLAN|nr:SIR2 family protein [Fuerstiella marisgermanici]APZ93309.1 hypothetical protein Fuma_02926 [Fuerstiella marisgermanici]
MRQIPKELIAALNSGQCIAVIGSGPSNELRFPSWKTLAEETVALAKEASGDKFEEDLFARLFEKDDYPKIFKYAETLLDRNVILTHIQKRLDGHEALLRGSSQKGSAYSCLTSWPLKFYLTTNWDSEIIRHLEFDTEFCSVLSNSKPELTQLSVGMTKQIVHLHGTLDDGDSVVLTDDDYQCFKTEDSHRYFRETLVSLFRTFPILIVGHSMRDPDIQTILESAKKIAPSKRTIFMIAADVQKEDIDEYLSKYNIHIIPYSGNRNHRELQTLLKGIERFVIPRRQIAHLPLDPITEDEIDFASSLLFSNSLYDKSTDATILRRLIRPQILRTLDRSPTGCDEEEIRKKLIPNTLQALPTTASALPEILESLSESGLLSLDGESWKLTDDGKSELGNTKIQAKLQDEEVVSTLIAHLTANGFSTEDVSRVKTSLVSSIADVFRRRGVAAASFIFRDQAFEPVDMAELFEAITRSMSWIESFEARQTVVDFAIDLFTKPTEAQRSFLARLSQGFFAVHIFGSAQFASQPRTDLLSQSSWLLDSNVLIYLFAVGSPISRLSQEICNKSKQLGITLTTTEALIEESLKGLSWATDMCEGLTAEEEMEFMLQVFNGATYRQNPYIEGFVGLSRKQTLRRFSEYRRFLSLDTLDKAVKRVQEVGVEIVSVEDDVSDDAELSISEVAKKIEEERARRGTGRGGEKQAFVEAEVLCLLAEERGGKVSDFEGLAPAYFVSSSQLLDQMYGGEYGVLTWKPEMLFRHLSLLCPDSKDDATIVEAMATEYSELGISLIDEDAFRSYFEPLISTSRLSYQREKASFISAVEGEAKRSVEELDEEFQSVSDLAKPLFVSQMFWREQTSEKTQLRRELKRALERKEALDTKLKKEEADWEEKRKKTIEHYENRIRNLTDPKRRRHVERKSKNRQKRRRK